MTPRTIVQSIGIGIVAVGFLAAPGRANAQTAAACDGASASTLANWHPADGVAHGVQEFDRSVRFVVPPGVTTISVELWGAGGGGGGGSAETYTEGGSGGGGGASGAYGRTVLQVQPGATYTIVVGHGGRGGTAALKSAASSGEDGQPSMICAGNAVLFVVPGGAGGQGPRTNDHGGTGGKAGQTAEAGGAATAGVYRASRDGASGSAPLFEYRGWGGKGGTPVSGTVAPQGGFGGQGGRGGMRPDLPTEGQAGADGSAIVTW